MYYDIKLFINVRYFYNMSPPVSVYLNCNAENISLTLETIKAIVYRKQSFRFFHNAQP